MADNILQFLRASLRAARSRIKLPTALAVARPQTEIARMGSALAISCLLHAAVIVLPNPGGRVSPADKQSPRTRPPAPVALSVFFATAHSDDAPAQNPPADSGMAVDIPPLAGTMETEAPHPRDYTKGADILPVSGTVYYTTDQLTKPPQAVLVPDLDTPELQPIVASGKLILKLWIDDQGTVADAQIEKSSLPEIFSRTAIAAFKSSRFVPGERDGVPVNTQMRIEVGYNDPRVRRR